MQRLLYTNINPFQNCKEVTKKKNVLFEKPLTYQSQDGEELAKLAKKIM